MFQNIADEVRAVHALRFPFKVQDKAMAQARKRYGAEILDADVETPLEQRTHFASQHQALHTTWARTVAHIPFDLLRRCLRLRVRGHHHTNSIVFHMRSNRDVTYKLLRLEDFGFL